MLFVANVVATLLRFVALRRVIAPEASAKP